MILLRSIALIGLKAQKVSIEIDVQPWIPSCLIVGLWDTALLESRERIRSAIKNTGFIFPPQRVTINLAPAHLRKSGSQYDLALALGILLCKRPELHARVREIFCIWELALSGEIRPVTGAIPLILAAIKNGEHCIMVGPEDYCAVRSLDPNLLQDLICVRSLSEALIYIETGVCSSVPENESIEKIPEVPCESRVYASIIGHAGPKRAIEIAAAGSHNIILEWPPGSGKSMLAVALWELLPSISRSERIDVAQIYSLRGELGSFEKLHGRPFRQIHKSASMVSIIGGTSMSLPGEMSLAHKGVLFFDELLEFDRRCIESLREPLENRTITISRAHATITYPASFLFIGATNPCPCWYLWDAVIPCQDSDTDIKKYRSKLSGPILDRMDLHLYVWRVNPSKQTESDGVLEFELAKSRVEAAHAKAISRQGTPNSNLSVEETEKIDLSAEVITLLKGAVERFHLSLRAYHRLIRVSLTIADLSGEQKISPEHVLEALSYREK